MVRNYKRDVNSRKYRSDGHLTSAYEEAVERLRAGESQRTICKDLGITRSALQRRLKGDTKPAGGQTVLTMAEEECIISALIITSTWKIPLDIVDLQILVKYYLDAQGVTLKRFTNNTPGREWVRQFLRRHSDEITQRLPNNLSIPRSKLSREAVTNYFENLETLVDGVPSENIFNYDETALVDDPGRKKCIFRRGVKYPDRVMASSKSAVSVMWCGSASGIVLPPFVVYKSKTIMESWVTRGPKGLPVCDQRCCKSGSRFGCTPHGWFDGQYFTEWFKQTFLPHALHLDGPKVLIGDNLSSHFAPEVLELAVANNIRFTTIPPNSTHLLQPLDVAFFHPLKVKWRQILAKWKMSSNRNVSKNCFPRLLAQLVNELGPQMGNNMVSGFRATGIRPFNPEEPLQHLPEQDRQAMETPGPIMTASLLALLREIRGQTGDQKAAPKKRRKLAIEPGTSISVADVGAESPGESDGDNDGGDDLVTEADEDINRTQTAQVTPVADIADIDYGTDWVAAVYAPRKGLEGWYVGTAEKLSKHGEVLVNFMEPRGPGTQFKWPLRRDELYVDLVQVLCRLNEAPELVPGRGVSLQITQETADAIQALFDKYLKSH